MTREFDRGTRFGALYDLLSAFAPIREITRVTDLGRADFFQNYAAHSRPVIVQLRTAANERALDDIENKHGDRVIKVRHGDYPDPDNYRPERRLLNDMTLREYIKSLRSLSERDTPPYAGNFTLPIEFLGSLGASMPDYYSAERLEAPTVWLGVKGCITPLHRDSSDNFAIQLLGRKRWTIFPPQDAPYLYMSSVSQSKGMDFAASAIDLRRPDLARFPEFRNAKGITFELCAGEMLYVPMGWGHYVENLELSLMVNYWLSIVPSGVAALDGHK